MTNLNLDDVLGDYEHHSREAYSAAVDGDRGAADVYAALAQAAATMAVALQQEPDRPSRNERSRR